MKDIFPGHFGRSADELNTIWKSADFSFDANVLLNLYRYSEATLGEFFQILQAFGDRIWLSHQATEEFFRNRAAVIEGQYKSYENITRSLETTLAKLESGREHPFLSEPTFRSLKRACGRVTRELKAGGEKVAKRLTSDDVLKQLDIAFAGRVGAAYSPEKLQEVYEEGAKRYAKRTPPGFKDLNKKDAGELGQEFGDLVIWLQILDYASEHKRDIILVTDDRKEDWWWTVGQHTIGPRPELIAEFIKTSGQNFLMYKPEQFLRFASTHVGRAVNEEAVTEVKQVAEDAASVHRRYVLHSLNAEQWQEIIDAMNNLGYHSNNLNSETLVRDLSAEKSKLPSLKQSIEAMSDQLRMRQKELDALSETELSGEEVQDRKRSIYAQLQDISSQIDKNASAVKEASRRIDNLHRVAFLLADARTTTVE